MELSNDELDLLAKLREVVAHGWGTIHVTVQEGSIHNIDQHKSFRINDKKPTNAKPTR